MIFYDKKDLAALSSSKSLLASSGPISFNLDGSHYASTSGIVTLSLDKDDCLIVGMKKPENFDANIIANHIYISAVATVLSYTEPDV